MNGNHELRKNFLLSAALHAVVLAGFFFTAAFSPRPNLERPPIFMEIVGEGGGGEPSGGAPPPPPFPPDPESKAFELEKFTVEEPPPPKPEPKVEEKPEMVIPKEEPKKKVEKKIEPKKEEPKKEETKKAPAKPKVEVSKKLVKRSDVQKPSSTPRKSSSADPRYSADAVRKRFAAATSAVKVGSYAGSGSGPGKGTGGGSQFGDYYSMLSSILYDAWEIPGQVSPNAHTVVVVHVSSDGTLSFVKILTRSGNVTMDQSTVEAVNSVRKVPPPPAALGAGELTITFKPIGA